MKLTKWGLQISMTKPCVYCKAQPGQLCTRAQNSRAPWEARDYWEHGIHYGREDGTYGTSISATTHTLTPQEPVGADDLGSELYMASMLRSAK